jgi:hypothetical protein
MLLLPTEVCIGNKSQRKKPCTNQIAECGDIWNRNVVWFAAAFPHSKHQPMGEHLWTNIAVTASSSAPLAVWLIRIGEKQSIPLKTRQNKLNIQRFPK